MTIRTLVTVLVGPLGKIPQIPAFTLEWDEFEDGDIDDFFDSAFFKYALVPREAFEVRAEDASEEERRAWQVAYDSFEEEEGMMPPALFMHDIRPLLH